MVDLISIKVSYPFHPSVVCLVYVSFKGKTLTVIELISYSLPSLLHLFCSVV